jgi:SAM-dependent methyltransferase
MIRPRALLRRIARLAGEERVREWTDVVLEPLDSISRMINGKRGLPPLRIRRHSGALATFETSAASVLGFVNGAVGVDPGDRILDIGCGVGAVALQLRGYLQGGTYTGLDVHRPSIEWARRNIQRGAGRFRFVLADLRSGQYNPRGTLGAAGYRFPFGDGSFDLVLAKSVFTHLRPLETENYIREIARVLSPGGHALLTFFLLTPERGPLAPERGSLAFPHGEGPWRYHDAATPERACAYEAEYIMRLLEENGLELARPVLYGHQDVLLVRRKK